MDEHFKNWLNERGPVLRRKGKSRNPKRKEFSRTDDVKHRVFESDVERNWAPEEKATDVQMNNVFDILDSEGPMLQSELVRRLSDILGLEKGTAAGAVSASLLYFHKAGWVTYKRVDKMETLWKVEE